MESDDDFFAKAKPAGRVKQKRPTKTRTTIRLSDEVLTVYKHMGRGWQTQMDNDLKELIANKYGKPKIQLKNDTLYLEFKVENSSKVSGKETVQVYFSDEIASMTRPVKQLIRFEKRSIPAENSERFNFSIPVKDFGYYDENGVWKWEAGSYRIHVGPNSENTQMIAFECK